MRRHEPSIKDHFPVFHRIGPCLWVCIDCGGINAWNYGDAERAAARLKGFTKPKGSRAESSVAVAHGSCFDNVCGHCGADNVKADSPINHPCYTHA